MCLIQPKLFQVWRSRASTLARHNSFISFPITSYRVFLGLPPGLAPFRPSPPYTTTSIHLHLHTPSWPYTLHLHIHAFPHPILFNFLLHMNKPPQSVPLQNTTNPYMSILPLSSALLFCTTFMLCSEQLVSDRFVYILDRCLDRSPFCFIYSILSSLLVW